MKRHVGQGLRESQTQSFSVLSLGIGMCHPLGTLMCSPTRKLTGALVSRVLLEFHYVGMIELNLQPPLHYLEGSWVKAPTF